MPLISLITCSLAAGKQCGSVVCLARYWTRSSIWLISDASEISNSYWNKKSTNYF